MADFAYALHTDACTYLLDESGVCQWVLSPDPKTAAIVQACVGAHFVASLDARIKGNLTSDLVPGASALFATLSRETGRPILLRTGPILRVQFRNAESDAAVAPLPGLSTQVDEGDPNGPPTQRAPRPRKKSEGRKPPPLPKGNPSLPDSVTTQPKGAGKWIVPVRDSAPTAKRKIEPEESSITLVTYPGVPMRGSTARKEPPAPHPKSVADDAAPLLLKNKKKKG